MALFNIEDTIAAIATPVGEGGISVIRLSGPEAFSIAEQVFCKGAWPHWGQAPEERRQALHDAPSHTIHFGTILDEKGGVLDQVLLSIFRKPHSYTGEDVIEISAHGGVVVSRKILSLVLKKGARHAEPGEFTRRAFLNGRMDLAQAEAVLDLIKAKSEKSLETAVRQLTGSLSVKFKTLKEALMKLYAHMEAFLDFPEEDLEIYEDREFLEKFEKLESEMEQLIAGFRRGVLLREGVKVALVGKANVGKSSLFNALLARDRALVSEFPGTTRDVLEEAVEIGGMYVRLLDTAGLGLQSEHPLDQMGMERTRKMLAEGDLFLYLVDGSLPLEEGDRHAFAVIPAGKPVLVVVNKSDLGERIGGFELEQMTGRKAFLRVSAKKGEGLDALEKEMADRIGKEALEAEGEQITRVRHKNVLERALESLKNSHGSFLERESLEIVILDLKAAIDELRELIGEVYSEDLLDVIFAEFCIGK